MKTILFCLMALSLIINCAVASDETPVSYKPPYPFTADELWEKIIQVIKSENAYITTKQVENIFEVAIPRNQDNSLSHLAKRGRDWYFSLNVNDYGKERSGFVLGWDEVKIYTAKAPPDDICLNSRERAADIRKYGWRPINNFFTPRPGGEPDYDYYRKGKRSILRISFGEINHCISQIAMYSELDDLIDDLHDSALNLNNR